MLALPLMLSMLHAVPGSSASDGVHKWNDCIHSVEEEGDRRGELKAGVKNALRMTIHVCLKKMTIGLSLKMVHTSNKFT